jgi:predicted amidohydrolase
MDCGRNASAGWLDGRRASRQAAAPHFSRGQPCIVLGWPIERNGRKLVSGTALYSADGELMAKSRQIWIGRTQAPEAA